MMKRTVIVLSFVIFAWGFASHAQILYTENFNVILDSTRKVKGSFMPSFRYRNIKKEHIEIANTADVSFRLNNHAFTIANKLEYELYGEENIMSGGFVYMEYRHIQEQSLALEPFVQIHWQESRGLERKYAGGANLRWRVFVRPSIGIFAGLGALYQYERWNYSGVTDATWVPADPTPVELKQLRGNAYLSFKNKLGDLFDLDMSMYYQPAITKQPVSHRLASSTELTYNITQFFGLTLTYQNMYDSNPVVPINTLSHDVNLGVTFSF